MYVGELLHPPDLPIRAHHPTAANTLNLPQATGLDAGIKQPAIKSLLGHKTPEEFTIKRQRDNRDGRRGIIIFFLCPDCGNKIFAQTLLYTFSPEVELMRKQHIDETISNKSIRSTSTHNESMTRSLNAA